MENTTFTLIGQLGAAALLALALASGTGAAQAQSQPATRADVEQIIAVFRGEVREELAIVRKEMVEMELRLVLTMIGMLLGVLAILPFYLALLRRVLPGLFAATAPATAPVGGGVEHGGAGKGGGGGTGEAGLAAA